VAHSPQERRVAAQLDQGPPDPDAPECPAGVTVAEAAALQPDQRRAERVPGPGVGQAQQEPRVAAREREQARRPVSAQVRPDEEPPPLLLLAPAPALVGAAQAPGRAAGVQQHERARARRSPTRRQC
jgi:hypothetical protein